MQRQPGVMTRGMTAAGCAPPSVLERLPLTKHHAEMTLDARRCHPRGLPQPAGKQIAPGTADPRGMSATGPAGAVRSVGAAPGAATALVALRDLSDEAAPGVVTVPAAAVLIDAPAGDEMPLRTADMLQSAAANQQSGITALAGTAPPLTSSNRRLEMSDGTKSPLQHRPHDAASTPGVILSSATGAGQNAATRRAQSAAAAALFRGARAAAQHRPAGTRKLTWRQLHRCRPGACATKLRQVCI